jgi:magnesium transporter
MRIAGTAQLFARRTVPAGSHPGSFEVPADAHPTGIRAFLYEPGRCEERDVTSADELLEVVRDERVSWVDVEGLGDGAILAWLRDALGVHPLAVADIANTGQRPKFEDYGDRDLIVAQVVELDTEEGVTVDQASLIVGPRFVVSVLERPLPIFDPVRERVRSGTSTICKMSADFLTYTLLDAIVDGFFPVVEELGEVLTELEDEITTRPTADVLPRLHAARRTLLALHRVMYRQRDALGSMLRSDESPFSPAVRVYLRDAHDHAVQVLDIIESYREMAVGITDIYLSSVSNRMNEVMQTLTIVSTIFIPISFIAGVYGMNFEYMPELRSPWGYFVSLGLMAVVAGALVGWFWRRGWIGRAPRRSSREASDDADAGPR